MSTVPTPPVALRALDTLWIQVAGTLCNLACRHCLVSASPSNRTHEMMTLDEIRPVLEEAASLGVREYYFTGGEPFLNPELEAILEATLEQGPATVLTNGLLLDRERCARLARLARAAAYSLDLRVSLDGLDADANDSIRGAGTFRRVSRAIARLVAAGIDPVVTVSEVHGDAGSEAGRGRYLELLRVLGVRKPRLKVLPLFRIGAEAHRGGGYESWQRLGVTEAVDGGWEHLQCSSCRAVTHRGVWVCPILVNEPSARMGGRLADALGAFQPDHPACWTCHVEGATCRT